VTLEDLLKQAFADGLAEVTIRVSRYEADCKTPACYQAIAKHRDRISGPWGVGVTATPGSALRHALEPPAKPIDRGVFD
jgi:hypothetical protein